MTLWRDPLPVKIPPALASLDLPPLLAEFLLRRGISTAQAARAFLDPGARLPASPYDLPGMQAAVERLEMAIRNVEPVCVWGDFDVDGQTSTALLVETLHARGAIVSHHIPIRAVTSHGVHLPQLEEVLERGARLVLTCDTGIGAHDAVHYARARGVDFVITDHHDLGPNLPEAAAVVNPKSLPADHPLASLAGVGVAYKLAEALLAGPGYAPGLLEAPLDLVALGLIADVAVLRGETRALAQRGLARLRVTDRTGLREIASLAGQPLDRADEDYVGFVLAPRLNALGRLGDANPAVELLTTSDRARARVLATQLEGLNTRRKLLTSQVYQAARAQLDADPALLQEPAIVLWHPAWPGGVVGLVAGRLAERYHRPVVLFSAPQGEPARGSARSVEGLHITEAIATQASLLAGFGGHPMAAGLALPQEHLPAFRAGFCKAVERMRAEAPGGQPGLQIDAWLPLAELTLELADSLSALAPFGAGNPAPVFASRDLTLRSAAPLGPGGEHLRLRVADQDGNEQVVFWWNASGEAPPEGRFDLACTPRTRGFRGERELALQFMAARVVEARPVDLLPDQREVVDLRGHARPLEALTRRGPENAVVFAEGEHRRAIHGLDRYSLRPCADLVLYTCPPGPGELRAILETVQPERVFLIAEPTASEVAEAFLARLAGMAKYALAHKGGKASLPELTSACARREITVRLGLEWLAAAGHLTVRELEGGYQFASGSREVDPYAQEDLLQALRGCLEEEHAFRGFVATASDPASIFPRE